MPFRDDPPHHTAFDSFCLFDFINKIEKKIILFMLKEGDKCKIVSL